MATYRLIPGLETIRASKAVAQEQTDAANAQRLSLAPAAIRSVLPADVVYDEDPANWTLLVDPATGLYTGVEVRLYLTDGTHRAEIPLPGYVKLVDGGGVQLFLGSDPLPLTKLADWTRPTPMRSATAAYDRLLEMQTEAVG